MEIENANFYMDGSKALGMNEFPPLFFQHFWEEVGNDIFALVNYFLNKGHIPKELNSINITLIPKNVIYKIISKVLTNRLQEIIGT
ncbi:ribonuclease H [Senna tora]|uniref:Ribonuclease H n=1 Tax=Senna tora TaxID=362788 RepID=A0A834U2C2_9FABA|nr:ribonuclease H [Senna tora]